MKKFKIKLNCYIKQINKTNKKLLPNLVALNNHILFLSFCG